MVVRGNGKDDLNASAGLAGAHSLRDKDFSSKSPERNQRDDAADAARGS